MRKLREHILSRMMKAPEKAAVENALRDLSAELVWARSELAKTHLQDPAALPGSTCTSANRDGAHEGPEPLDHEQAGDSDVEVDFELEAELGDEEGRADIANAAAAAIEREEGEENGNVNGEETETAGESGSELDGDGADAPTFKPGKQRLYKDYREAARKLEAKVVKNQGYTRRRSSSTSRYRLPPSPV